MPLIGKILLGVIIYLLVLFVYTLVRGWDIFLAECKDGTRDHHHQELKYRLMQDRCFLLLSFPLLLFLVISRLLLLLFTGSRPPRGL